MFSQRINIHLNECQAHNRGVTGNCNKHLYHLSVVQIQRTTSLMYFIIRAQNHMQILHIQVMYILSRPHLPRFQSAVLCILVVTLMNLSYTNAETGVGTNTLPGHGRAVKCSTPTWYPWISGGRIENHKPHPGLPLKTALKRAFYV